MISIFFVRVSYIQTGGLTWMSEPTNPMGVGREFLRMSGIGILDQPLGEQVCTLKMDGWNTSRLPIGEEEFAVFFRGVLLAVSFREGR